jgi:hypothetical protein
MLEIGEILIIIISFVLIIYYLYSINKTPTHNISKTISENANIERKILVEDSDDEED